MASEVVPSGRHTLHHRETSPRIRDMCAGNRDLPPMIAVLLLYHLRTSSLNYRARGANRLSPFVVFTLIWTGYPSSSALPPYVGPAFMRVVHNLLLVLSKVEGTGALLKTHRRECRRGHVIQGAVRPIVIVIHPPAIRNISQFITVVFISRSLVVFCARRYGIVR